MPICGGGADDGKLCMNGITVCPGGACANTVPKGYGVRFSTVDGQNGRSIVFADIDGDKRYDSGEEIRDESLTPTPSVVVGEVSPADAGILDIVFEPPKPRVWYNGTTTSAEALVTLQHSVTGMTKAFSINAVSGRIGEQ
jgi:hypothetical protein